jgi:hypothetical protein
MSVALSAASSERAEPDAWVEATSTMGRIYPWRDRRCIALSNPDVPSRRFLTAARVFADLRRLAELSPGATRKRDGATAFTRRKP